MAHSAHLTWRMDLIRERQTKWHANAAEVDEIGTVKGSQLDIIGRRILLAGIGMCANHLMYCGRAGQNPVMMNYEWSQRIGFLQPSVATAC